MVCSIRTTCDADSMYLFAANPILAQRVESVLTDSRVRFSIRDQMFALHNRTDRARVLECLLSRLSEPEANDLRVTYDLANLMAATSLAQASQREETAWFEAGLANDAFDHWFQPIVNARERAIIGHECLIRLPRPGGGSPYGGQEIIDAAIARGDLHIFDSYSRRSAVRNAAKQCMHGRVFINFTPSSIYDPAFCMISTLEAMEKTSFKPADIVFEVVECERVSNPGHLRKIVDFYRAKGFGVALDDVGTGSNSLQMIADIQPDYIKLDKSIVWKYETEIGMRLLRKLSEFSSESGIAVIAEGIETEEMRDKLLETGISLMQGYYFGKPAPVMAHRFPAFVETPMAQ